VKSWTSNLSDSCIYSRLKKLLKIIKKNIEGNFSQEIQFKSGILQESFDILIEIKIN
jgi:hypothetical protein